MAGKVGQQQAVQQGGDGVEHADTNPVPVVSQARQQASKHVNASKRQSTHAHAHVRLQQQEEAAVSTEMPELIAVGSLVADDLGGDLAEAWRHRRLVGQEQEHKHARNGSKHCMAQQQAPQQATIGRHQRRNEESDSNAGLLASTNCHQ